MENKDNIIKEIREKIKINPKYIHPTNREFQEDIKKYGFNSGYDFVSWMQNNGILKNPTDIKRKEYQKTANNARFNNINEYIREGYRYKSMHLSMSENTNCSAHMANKKKRYDKTWK